MNAALSASGKVMPDAAADVSSAAVAAAAAAFCAPVFSTGGQPGEMAACLLDGSLVKQVPVLLQARNAGHAWVAQGLKAGERVGVYPPTALKDGARVIARRG